MPARRSTGRLARTVALSGAAVLLTAGLAACGSDNSSSGSASGDYCSELKADKAYFGGLDSSKPDVSDLDQIFERMHTLADDAPAAVADDWQTLDGAFSTIENALKEAGLKPSDLAALQNGQPPAGADLAKLQELAPKLQALSSSDVTAAADRIASNAKKACGVDLNDS